jgi:hypothetical protein
MASREKEKKPIEPNNGDDKPETITAPPDWVHLEAPERDSIEDKAND